MSMSRAITRVRSAAPARLGNAAAPSRRPSASIRVVWDGRWSRHGFAVRGMGFLSCGRRRRDDILLFPMQHELLHEIHISGKGVDDDAVSNPVPGGGFAMSRKLRVGIAGLGRIFDLNCLGY